MEVHVKRKSKRRRRKNKILWVLMICMGISTITICATILLAGKTGTAEIKVSKEDTSSTELGGCHFYSRKNRGQSVFDYKPG